MPQGSRKEPRPALVALAANLLKKQIRADLDELPGSMGMQFRSNSRSNITVYPDGTSMIYD